jgi:signal recognition particle GTPase
MDKRLAEAGFTDGAYWANRMQQVRLELFDKERTELRETAELSIDGILNLIGMVSSGKTTLITVLSVWAVQQGLHITLIVGDVMSALDRAQLFTRLGLDAAPILGASNRIRHPIDCIEPLMPKTRRWRLPINIRDLTG